MLNEMLEFGVTNANIPAFGTVRYGQQFLGMVVNQTTITGGNLLLRGTTAPWVIDAAKKLEALGRLPTGWDSYGGLPLDSHAKTLTVSALGWLEDKNLPVPAVVLGSAGTVQLEWRVKGRELEIELGKNETVEFVKLAPEGVVEEGEEKTNLPQRLRSLTWWLLYG